MYKKHESRVAKIAVLQSKIRGADRQIEAYTEAKEQYKLDIENAERTVEMMAEVLKQYEEVEEQIAEMGKELYAISHAYMSSPDYDPEVSYLADKEYMRIDEEREHLKKSLVSYEGQINKIFYGKA